jgi:hypothetical protein
MKPWDSFIQKSTGQYGGSGAAPMSGDEFRRLKTEEEALRKTRQDQFNRDMMARRVESENMAKRRAAGLGPGWTKVSQSTVEGRAG